MLLWSFCTGIYGFVASLGPAFCRPVPGKVDPRQDRRSRMDHVVGKRGIISSTPSPGSATCGWRPGLGNASDGRSRIDHARGRLDAHPAGGHEVSMRLAIRALASLAHSSAEKSDMFDILLP
jgi:hypothetical protein